MTSQDNLLRRVAVSAGELGRDFLLSIDSTDSMQARLRSGKTALETTIGPRGSAVTAADASAFWTGAAQRRRHRLREESWRGEASSEAVSGDAEEVTGAAEVEEEEEEHVSLRSTDAEDHGSLSLVEEFKIEPSWTDASFTAIWNRGTPQSERPGAVPERHGVSKDRESSTDMSSQSRAVARVKQVSDHFLQEWQERQESQRWDRVPGFDLECSYLRQSPSNPFDHDITQEHPRPTKYHRPVARTTGGGQTSNRYDAYQARVTSPPAQPSRSETRHDEVDVSFTDFQCPLPHCQHAFATGASWIKEWQDVDDPRTLRLSREQGESRICVHDGCLEHFSCPERWRIHISQPHHQDLTDKATSLTERMMRVWIKRKAFRN